MHPIDIRNETWESIQGRLTGDRLAVYDELWMRGPRTTRALAQDMGKRCEDVRPRVTELCQMGFVEVTQKIGHEGVYRALGMAAAHAYFDEQKAAGDQVLMRI